MLWDDYSGAQSDNDLLGLGVTTRVLQMVNRLICHLYPGSPRLRAGDIWFAFIGWRPSNGGMVLVHRLMHGYVHWKLRGRASIGISYGRRDVLCYKARRTS